jgi:hypothetical protein
MLGNVPGKPIAARYAMHPCNQQGWGAFTFAMTLGSSHCVGWWNCTQSSLKKIPLILQSHLCHCWSRWVSIELAVVMAWHCCRMCSESTLKAKALMSSSPHMMKVQHVHRRIRGIFFSILCYKKLVKIFQKIAKIVQFILEKHICPKLSQFFA